MLLLMKLFRLIITLLAIPLRRLPGASLDLRCLEANLAIMAAHLSRVVSLFLVLVEIIVPTTSSLLLEGVIGLVNVLGGMLSSVGIHKAVLIQLLRPGQV